MSNNDCVNSKFNCIQHIIHPPHTLPPNWVDYYKVLDDSVTWNQDFVEVKTEKNT